MALYESYRISEKLIFISGQLPFLNNKILCAGKIGQKLSENDGKTAIRQATCNLLLTLNLAIKENKLDSKKVKMLNLKGYINSSSQFSNHSEILNEASAMIISVLGKKNGMHSRSVLGVNSLPLNSSVEIEGILSIF